MSTSTLSGKSIEVPMNSDRESLLSQERFVVDLLEHLCMEMEKQGVSRNDLAQRLGINPVRLKRMFQGGPRVNLRMVVACFHALGLTLQITTSHQDPSTQKTTAIQKAMGLRQKYGRPKESIFPKAAPISGQQ